LSEEKRRNLSASAKGAISLGSGLTAGVAAAVLSQPADTLLSQVSILITSLATTLKHVAVCRSTKVMGQREAWSLD
jgi:hypothetical protein